MKTLVLFDIDETMIKSEGVGRRAIGAALNQVCGIPPAFPNVMLSGKTDPQICAEVLSDYGFSQDEIESKLPRIFETYLPILSGEISRAASFSLHSGVVSLIESLVQADNAYLGLLTGNIEPGARLKLNPFNLNDYFPLGAFGSDSADRMKLPAVAHGRANQAFGLEFRAKDIVIIGDSINDISCARGYGARAVAVATGKTSRLELQKMQPDLLLESLADTDLIVRTILGLH